MDKSSWQQAVYCLHFYIVFIEEAQYYWLFGRGGTILLASRERKHHLINWLCSKLAIGVGWNSIYGPRSTWKAGKVVLSKLFYWCDLISINREVSTYIHIYLSVPPGHWTRISPLLAVCLFWGWLSLCRIWRLFHIGVHCILVLWCYHSAEKIR